MERRASERVPTNIATSCRVPATAHSATILDLSHAGCRVRVRDLAVPLGATVHFDFAPHSRVSGQVVWVDAAAAGVRFDSPLRPAVAVQLGIEQPRPVEVASVAIEVEPASLPVVLRHWVRRLCGLAA